MKIKNSLIFLFFMSLNLISQEDEWYEYDLDSIASLDMPFDVFEIDTIVDYSKIYQIYSENKTAKFLASKSYIGKRYANIETLKLPYNSKELNKFYIDLINVLDVLVGEEFDYQKKIKKNNINGYEVSYKNKNETKVQQVQLFYINKNLYLFRYINENGLNENFRNFFFDSIVFDDEQELLQYPKMSIERKIIIGLFILLFLSFLYRFKPTKKSSSFR